MKSTWQFDIELQKKAIAYQVKKQVITQAVHTGKVVLNSISNAMRN